MNRITLEPGKRGGRPCIRGLRISVYDVLSMLSSGMPHEEILADFPELETEDILAVLAFAAAALLGPGDLLAYFVVCTLAGLALGADLALPPVLLAGLIPAEHSAAAYYGIWTFLGKLALAISGLALPLLALGGYTPGVAGAGGLTLALVYAGLPCLIKLLAMWRLHGVLTPSGRLA